MEQDRRWLLEEWKKLADEFEGDKTLFWAGRMAIAAQYIERSNSLTLSDDIWLLIKCKDIYDGIIMESVRK